MKKLTIILLLLLSTQLFSNKFVWIDEQIEAIKPPRKGINSKKILKLKDPFIYLRKKRRKKNIYRSRKHSGSKRAPVYTPKISLVATLNKSALINGKWYREGEKVYGYKLEKVNPKTVLLTKGKKQLLLSIASKSKNLKFNNK